MESSSSSQRVNILLKHLQADSVDRQGPVRALSAARDTSLPRFDAVLMENFLDGLSSLKEEVYETFRLKPNLLPSTLEGLSKGTTWVLRSSSQVSGEVVVRPHQ
jgi:hypothetical protein